jgi:hypothetical protein
VGESAPGVACVAGSDPAEFRPTDAKALGDLDLSHPRSAL